MKIETKLVIDEFAGEGAQRFYVQKAEEGLWDSEKRLINKYFKQKTKVLDVGCGTGRTTIPLNELGYKVIGIDITPKMIENAKKIAKNKRLKIDYRVMDARNLKFKANSFDSALFSNQGWTQIPGSENKLKALKEIYRVLKPEGVYLFSFHKRRLFSKYFFFWVWAWFKFYVIKNLGFKINELDFGDRLFKRESSGMKYKTKQYIHIASINEVKKQVESAGFEILYKGTGLNEGTGSKPIFFVCKKRIR